MKLCVMACGTKFTPWVATLWWTFKLYLVCWIIFSDKVIGSTMKRNVMKVFCWTFVNVMATETENAERKVDTEEVKNELPKENKTEDQEIKEDLKAPVIEIQVVFSFRIWITFILGRAMLQGSKKQSNVNIFVVGLIGLC